MPKFYAASRTENWYLTDTIADALTAKGWIHTYRWTRHGSVGKEQHERKAEIALLETNGVKDADVLIVFGPGGRGTHCEIGIALGANKPIFLWAKNEKVLQNDDDMDTPFYHHPNVTRCFCHQDDIIKNIIAWSKRIKDQLPVVYTRL